MATSLIPKSAGSHDAFVEPRCVRITFGGRWEAASRPQMPCARR